MTDVLSVPQADPGAVYRAHQAAIDQAIRRVLESGWYILGKEDAAFEAEFAAWLGMKHAVGCANGTDALALCLRGLGVGPGMAVATVSHTAVATVAAIEMVGATPVLIDIDPATYTMDPAEFAHVLANAAPGLPPVRAVIPVHLYGQPADLDPIRAAAAKHGVAVIEDCSQAHGATLGGRKVGTMTECSAFSLYPTKNLGAFGDAGVLTCNDTVLAERIGALRQYGWKERYISDLAGVNSRLDELHAAVLRVLLPQLDQRNARRQQIAARYDAALQNTCLTPPVRRAGATHVFHQYVVRSAERAVLQDRLKAQGIATAIHYPVPIHQQPAYRGSIAMGPAACRNTELAAQQIFSLPLFAELSDAQVDHVCGALKSL